MKFQKASHQNKKPPVFIFLSATVSFFPCSSASHSHAVWTRREIPCSASFVGNDSIEWAWRGDKLELQTDIPIADFSLQSSHCSLHIAFPFSLQASSSYLSFPYELERDSQSFLDEKSVSHLHHLPTKFCRLRIMSDSKRRRGMWIELKYSEKRLHLYTCTLGVEGEEMKSRENSFLPEKNNNNSPSAAQLRYRLHQHPSRISSIPRDVTASQVKEEKFICRVTREERDYQ